MGHGKERKRAIAVRLSETDLRHIDAMSRLFTDAGDGVIQYTRTDVIRLAVRQLAEKHIAGYKAKADE